MKKFLDNLSLDDFFAQLFGSFLQWRVKASKLMDLQKADVIISLSFGFRFNEPGLTNEALSKIVEDLYQRYKLPLILQWEIAEASALDSKALSNIIRYARANRQTGFITKTINKLFGTGKNSDPNLYLDTFEAADQCREVMEKNNWKTAILVAHQDHCWRLTHVMKKMGIKILIPYATTDIYDLQSVQKYTQTRAKFVLREIPTRIYYLLRGWM